MLNITTGNFCCDNCENVLIKIKNKTTKKEPHYQIEEEIAPFEIRIKENENTSLVLAFCNFKCLKIWVLKHEMGDLK